MTLAYLIVTDINAPKCIKQEEVVVFFLVH